MKITINGEIGSGKSRVGEELAHRLSYRCIDIGELVKSQVAYSNTTLEEFLLNEKTVRDCKDLDVFIKTFGEGRISGVVVGSVAWYFIPNSVKVYLKCNETEAARRLKNSKRHRFLTSISSIIDKAKNLRKLEVERFRRMYNVDITDLKNYDLVIDTTNKTVEEVVAEIQHFATHRLAS